MYPMDFIMPMSLYSVRAPREQDRQYPGPGAGDAGASENLFPARVTSLALARSEPAAPVSNTPSHLCSGQQSLAFFHFSIANRVAETFP